jgi:hypothetical protein
MQTCGWHIFLSGSQPGAEERSIVHDIFNYKRVCEALELKNAYFQTTPG